MIPYPLIDVKATGENILRRRLERGLHGFGHAAVPEPGVSPVRVSLAGRTDTAEHR